MAVEDVLGGALHLKSVRGSFGFCLVLRYNRYMQGAVLDTRPTIYGPGPHLSHNYPGPRFHSWGSKSGTFVQPLLGGMP